MVELHEAEDLEGSRMNKQIPPDYWQYTGGWCKVTRCRDCGSTGLWENQHTASPCKSCGGKVDKVGSGLWTPLYKYISIFSVFTIPIRSGGYWKIKDGTV